MCCCSCDALALVQHLRGQDFNICAGCYVRVIPALKDKYRDAVRRGAEAAISNNSRKLARDISLMFADRALHSSQQGHSYPLMTQPSALSSTNVGNR